MLHLGETVSSIEAYHDDHGDHVRLHLASGKQVVADKALYSVGRRGATDTLRLEAAGLAGRRPRTAARQRALSDRGAAHLRGRRRHRLPSLASTSMEQGRLAACHAFGVPTHSLPELFPYGIFTVPGMSMVGRTEESS